MRRFPRLTDAQVRRLIEAYWAGASTYQLAEQFGIHRETVAGHLRRAGISTRGLERVELTDEQLTHARILWEGGISYHRIGVALGLSQRAVARALRAT